MSDMIPDMHRIAADLLKDLASSFWERAKSITSDQLGKLRVAMRIGTESYIRDCLNNVSYVKTILYRDRDVHLSNFYVETRFRHDGNAVTQDEFFELLEASNRAIISGNAGSGKSIFMRYCTIHFLKSNRRRIPIFVELRHLNHHKVSILHFIHENIIRPTIRNMDLATFDYALRSGLFVLVLDGFDELNFDRRPQHLQDIHYIRSRFGELPIILSTRPDESTISLSGFNVFHVDKLSKESSIRLINKLEFDTEIKNKFKQSLRKKYYKTHIEFASNPLLLTMLLLTFDQVGDIPTKMHIFYNQAFEVLVLKHDRLKSLYTRKTYSRLDIEQMRRVFSYICARSYFDRQISFTESRLNELLFESLEFNNIDEDVDNIKNDLIGSFSMMKRDGLYITFVHRSFQEFFAAYFLSRVEGIDITEVVNDIAERGMVEQCLGLFFDMSPERFSEMWLIPTLHEFSKKVEQFAEDLVLFVRTYYLGIRYDNGRVRLVGKSRNLRILETAISIAGPRLNRKVPDLIASQGDVTFSIDTGKTIAFFGGSTPYYGKAVVPTREDNQWLVGSGLSYYISLIADLIGDILSDLSNMCEVRRSKASLFVRPRSKEDTNFRTEEFGARGNPQEIVDSRTGEVRIIPRMRTIARNVIDDT